MNNLKLDDLFCNFLSYVDITSLPDVRLINKKLNKLIVEHFQKILSMQLNWVTILDPDDIKHYKLVTKLLLKEEYDLSKITKLASRLEILHLMHSKKDSIQLTELGRGLKAVPNLRVLRIMTHSIKPEEALKVVSELCRRLEQFTIAQAMESTPVTDKNVQGVLDRNQGLTQLSLLTPNNKYTDELVRSICKTKIQSVTINCFKKLTNLGMQMFCSSPTLTSLSLTECRRVTDEGFVQLPQSRITQLELTGFYEVTDEGLKYVAATLNLVSLHVISCSKVTNAGIASLSTLTKLTELNIEENDRITVEALVGFSSLTNLKKLTVGNGISEEDLNSLEFLNQLKDLELTYEESHDVDSDDEKE